MADYCSLSPPYTPHTPRTPPERDHSNGEQRAEASGFLKLRSFVIINSFTTLWVLSLNLLWDLTEDIRACSEIGGGGPLEDKGLDYGR